MGKPLITDLAPSLQLEIGDADKIKSIPVDITEVLGKDGYVLAYDEINNKIYLKADEGGGGGFLTMKASPGIATLAAPTMKASPGIATLAAPTSSSYPFA